MHTLSQMLVCFKNSESGNLSNIFTYTGRELDPESGLYYYRARYYDPVIGRFLQEDLVFGDPDFPQTLNGYAYVINSPLNFVDPDGLFSLAGGALFAGPGNGSFGIPAPAVDIPTTLSDPCAKPGILAAKGKPQDKPSQGDKNRGRRNRPRNVKGTQDQIQDVRKKQKFSKKATNEENFDPIKGGINRTEKSKQDLKNALKRIQGLDDL